jgi:hypothetical protein
MSVEKGSNASTEEMVQDIAEARFICIKEIKNAQTKKFQRKILEEVWGMLNPILHTACLYNHALTLKGTTSKFYYGEKSSVLHIMKI